jgi:hypothetical protein
MKKPSQSSQNNCDKRLAVDVLVDAIFAFQVQNSIGGAATMPNNKTPALDQRT